MSFYLPESDSKSESEPSPPPVAGDIDNIRFLADLCWISRCGEEEEEEEKEEEEEEGYVDCIARLVLLGLEFPSPLSLLPSSALVLASCVLKPEAWILGATNDWQGGISWCSRVCDAKR
jgi:hypothetical protein